MGHLVCEKCKGYYKLQPGESPVDFSNICECGGKLKYYDDDDFNDASRLSDNLLSLENLHYYLFNYKLNLKIELKVWGVFITILALIELYFAVDILLHIKGEPLMLILSFLIGIGSISLGILSFIVNDKKIYWTYSVLVIALLFQSLLLTNMSLPLIQIMIFLLPLIYFIRRATTKA